MTTLALVLLFVVAAIWLTAAVADRRFRSRVSAEVETLLASNTAYIGPEQLAARGTKLPEPVRRYLGFAVPEQAPAIRTMRLTHGGLFRTKPNQRWQNIKGEEYVAVAVPEFVWSAVIYPAPLLSIVARDRLQSGRASMLVKVNSLFTIADASGAEIDQGASLRWLTEAMWFPYAFVGDRIHWDAIDDHHSARATLRQPNLSVSAIFEFDDNGKITTIRANRFRDLGKGRSALTPWTALCSEYREFNGFRVPTVVDVAWEVDQQRFSYAQFHVTAIQYNATDRVH